MADQLSDCCKCKKTGFLERDAQGSLDFLGSRFSKSEVGGPLTLGLPASIQGAYPLKKIPTRIQ